jgi:hypothetical protein
VLSLLCNQSVKNSKTKIMNNTSTTIATQSSPRIGKRSIDESNMSAEELAKLAERRRLKAEASRACNARKRAEAKGLEICPSFGYKRVSTKKDLRVEDLRFAKTVGDITTTVKVQRAGIIGGFMVVTTVKQNNSKPVKTYQTVKSDLEDTAKVYNKTVSSI